VETPSKAAGLARSHVVGLGAGTCPANQNAHTANDAGLDQNNPRRARGNDQDGNDQNNDANVNDGEEH